MESCSARIGSRRPSAVATSAALAIAALRRPPPPFAALCVMNVRDRTQLRRLFFRRRVVQKIPAADLRSREIFEETRFAQWRGGPAMGKESPISLVRGRLVPRHPAWKRKLPA